MSPLTITLNVTDRCNLSCAYCYGSRAGWGRPAHGNAASMPPSMAREAIRWLARAFPRETVAQVNFHGGESLLNLAAMRAACEEAREVFPTVAHDCVTNGTLLGKSALDLAREYGVVFVVSLDGPRELHDRARRFPGGQGSHERCLEGLGRLLNRGLRFRINSVVSRPGDIPLVYDFLAGWCGGYETAVEFIPEYGVSFLEGRFDPDEYHDALVEVATKSTSLRVQNVARTLVMLVTGTSLRRFCQAGSSQFGVTADGTILPCFRLGGQEREAYAIGTIAGGLNEPRRASFVRGLEVDDKPGCRECDIKGICGGGCIANLVEYGQGPYLPLPSYCRLIRAEVRAAQRIYDRLWDVDPFRVLSLVKAGANASPEGWS